MTKILIPASRPEDWKQFLAEPEKQWNELGDAHKKLRNSAEKKEMSESRVVKATG